MTSLEFVQGTSDKFYRIYTADGQVICQYGRNGTFGTFTPAKAAADPAAAAAKAVNGKAIKGYRVTVTAEADLADTTPEALSAWADTLTPGDSPATLPAITPEREQSAVVTALTDEKVDGSLMTAVRAALHMPVQSPATVTTPVPMLAHVADADTLAGLLADPGWVMQEKVDGDRAMVVVQDGEVSVFGRNGQPKKSNVGRAFLAPFRGLTEGRWVFDGEIVGRDLLLFDLPVADGYLADDGPFSARFGLLAVMVALLDSEAVRLVPCTSAATAVKAEALAEFEADRKEGVILRRLDATYRVGRSTDLLKFKFVKTVDAVVVEIGRGGKQTAALAVHGPDGLVEIGNASTIGKGNIEAGQVVEVAFLYVVSPDNPVLYQPRILRVRDDKAAAECDLAQLVGAHRA